MTVSILATAARISIAAIAPYILTPCVLIPPPSEPDPIQEEAIFAPVAPGITYESLPIIDTETQIIDTSPDQIIGCANELVTGGEQLILNALFPGAEAGDGVVDRNTNDIWTYDGSIWTNVGPTPGPTLTVTSLVLPYNETAIYDARLRVGSSIIKFDYALELLTEPGAYVVALGVVVRSAPAFVKVPITDINLAASLPAVSGGASVFPPVIASTLETFAPEVSGGASVFVPLTDISFAVSPVPYSGKRATLVQASQDILLTIDVLDPLVAGGASIKPSTVDIAAAGLVPVVNPVPPVISIPGASGASTSAFFPNFANVQTNDILLLVVETSGNGSDVTPVPGEPGWNILAGTPLFDGNASPTLGSKLHVWWYRATAPIEFASVTFSDSGDHQVGRVYLIRGCVPSGDPFDVIGTATKPVPSTSASAPSITTTVPQTLVVSIVSQPMDSTVLQFSAPSNTGLTSLAGLDEIATNVGNGGGFVIASGIKRQPGETGTINYSTVSSVSNASVVIAFKS